MKRTMKAEKMHRWTSPPNFRSSTRCCPRARRTVSFKRPLRSSNRFSRSVRPRRYASTRRYTPQAITSMTTPNRAYMMMAAECGRFHRISRPIVFIWCHLPGLSSRSFLPEGRVSAQGKS